MEGEEVQTPLAEHACLQAPPAESIPAESGTSDEAQAEAPLAQAVPAADTSAGELGIQAALHSASLEQDSKLPTEENALRIASESLLSPAAHDDTIERVRGLLRALSVAKDELPEATDTSEGSMLHLSLHTQHARSSYAQELNN